MIYEEIAATTWTGYFQNGQRLFEFFFAKNNGNGVCLVAQVRDGGGEF
jgi:hypothetical protein